MATTTLIPTSPEALNELFGRGQQLAFEKGQGDLTIARLASPHAEATVSIYAGHVLSYVPTGQPPVLWVSEQAIYAEGKAIRGGVPVIWPWFGPHASNPDKPSHGFARKQYWEVHATRLITNQIPQLRLTLQDDALSYSLWPHCFRLELVITLSDVLDIDLEIVNTGKGPFDCGGALHTYFTVSQIENVTIHGLKCRPYIDQLDNHQTKYQQTPITFNAETDNIYFNTKDTCRLVDRGFGRTVIVEKRGSSSTVVWNPWIDKAQRMADFGDEEYKTMLCIETANAGPDVITLNPGGEHRLGTTLGVINSIS